MAQKHNANLLKRHYTDHAPHGADQGKGSRYWQCNYCEWRFIGTASKLRDHFERKCNINLVARLLSAEERISREAAIRQEVRLHRGAGEGRSGLLQDLGRCHQRNRAEVGGRVCVKAGKMVEVVYPWIFLVGCTAHALDLALEDMCKRIRWPKRVVENGSKLEKFFTNVDKVRVVYWNAGATMQVKRPAVIRFTTHFETLQSIKDAKFPLQQYVVDPVWKEKLVRPDQVANFLDMTTIILDTTNLWPSVEKAHAVMEPVVELLCLVDGPSATIGKVYFRMDSLVERMRNLDCLTEDE
ncbi:hypothetical protein CBR_g48159 [Chara braunii]|uniref:DUF659 domain-containing protein n=1 Tax=Chara braunii TaxID=69332 RepID=A0A388M221_CHABU|nr:hypothetical protein CBR_g48159 [Chara braunii]|eukprot:GBG88628.1 hypothetical protein CBR_g48159 [Chara braunii]